MFKTIYQYFSWNNVKKDITSFVKTCPECQIAKRLPQRYGKLPQKDTEVEPWHDVAVDLAGPWQCNINEREESFWALTIVDPFSTWPEIVPIKTKVGPNIAHLFDREWLCRYPRPKRCIYDAGSEFTCNEFQELLTSFGIQPVPTTIKNPTANAITERLHQTMGNHIRVQLAKKEQAYLDPLAEILSATAWAIRSSVHSVLNYTPGQLVFSRDMLLRFKVDVDLRLARARREKATKENTRRENKSRIEHQYKVGDKILLLPPHNARKLDLNSPLTVTKVNNTNGTVKVQRNGYQETLSYRRIRPFYQRS
jgi:hypothetical protein